MNSNPASGKSSSNGKPRMSRISNNGAQSPRGTGIPLRYQFFTFTLVYTQLYVILLRCCANDVGVLLDYFACNN